MIQLVYGCGKGKTSYAAGAALRAAGNDIPVLFAQFLKQDTSGEITLLRTLPGVRMLHAPHFYGFWSRQTDAERAVTRREAAALLEEAVRTAGEAVQAAEGSASPETEAQKPEDAAPDAGKGSGEASAEASGSRGRSSLSCMIILDELLTAVSAGVLPQSAAERFLDTVRQKDPAGERIEVILTGRQAPASLKERADYISQIRKEKHPFDRGITARKGVEY